MWSRAFEIEAVAGFQAVVLLAVQPDFKITTQDVQKFFALVRIGFAAAAARFYAEEMRLHRRIAPGEQFHANVRCRLQDFSLRWANEPGMFPGSFEKREDVGAIEAGNAAERGNRRAHLAPLEAAEKSYRYAGGSRDLREGESPADSQAPEALTGMRLYFRSGRNNALAFKHMNDGGRIEAAGAAEKNRALEQAHVGFGIEAIAALRAQRRDEAKGLPGAQSGRRNPDAARDFTDAQVTLHPWLC